VDIYPVGFVVRFDLEVVTRRLEPAASRRKAGIYRADPVEAMHLPFGNGLDRLDKISPRSDFSVLKFGSKHLFT